ncbi:MAG: Fe-S-containing hydro-lyase [Oscillospiraceae bacterium]|nr:Fe-S-containing hydro-lyase [Oscillospiraceae bacterium]
MREFQIHTSCLDDAIGELNAGDRVFLTGTIFTARDAAHKRMIEMLDRGEELPIPIQGNVVYYAGPTPAQQGMAVGACGPTTAGRMDPFTPRLLRLGLRGMIGKGDRSPEVQQEIVLNSACYFAAVGGAGALMAKCIKRAEVIAFEDLGCESIKAMEVESMPLIVAIDANGGNLYRSGRQEYRTDRHGEENDL